MNKLIIAALIIIFTILGLTFIEFEPDMRDVERNIPLETFTGESDSNATPEPFKPATAE